MVLPARFSMNTESAGSTSSQPRAVVADPVLATLLLPQHLGRRAAATEGVGLIVAAPVLVVSGASSVPGLSSAVVDAFAAVPAAKQPLVTSFRTRLATAKVEGADAFVAQAQARVGDGVIPAYRRISAYLATVRPQAPHDAGIWRLPNGDALYRALIRQMTDVEREPAEVHRIAHEGAAASVIHIIR